MSEIPAALRWLRANTDAAERIAAAGSDLVRSHLRFDDAINYVRGLLIEYSALLREPVRMPSGREGYGFQRVASTSDLTRITAMRPPPCPDAAIERCRRKRWPGAAASLLHTNRRCGRQSHAREWRERCVCRVCCAGWDCPGVGGCGSR